MSRAKTLLSALSQSRMKRPHTESSQRVPFESDVIRVIMLCADVRGERYKYSGKMLLVKRFASEGHVNMRKEL